MIQPNHTKSKRSTYRGSPLSTIFGTWKKPYYAKFVLVESTSTSTDFHQSPPTSTNSNSTNSNSTNFYQRTPLARPQCTASWYASFSFHNGIKVFMKSYCLFLFIKLHIGKRYFLNIFSITFIYALTSLCLTSFSTQNYEL